MNRIFIFVALLFFLSQAFSQEVGRYIVNDSLKNKSYEELIDLFVKHPLKDTLNKAVYSKALLNKAKAEKNKLEIARAYRFTSFIYYKNYPLRIIYLDSSIAVSRNLQGTKYPMVSYSNLGAVYSNLGEYPKAMEAYLKGLEYSEKNDNKDFTHIIKHNIARLKSKIGDDDEAVNIFKSVLDYNESSGYTGGSNVNTMLSLANSYRKLNQNDSATFYNKKAILLAFNNYKPNYYYGVLSEGINLYYKQEYQKALDSIQKALPYIEKNQYFVAHDFIANGYLHEGKIYQKLKKPIKKLESLFKLDDFLTDTNFASLESRQGYEMLIKHFKEKESKDQELFYTQKLIKYDSLLYQNFKSLTDKIIREYDTSILLKEEKKLIESLKEEKIKINYSLWISVFIGIIIFIILIITYVRQRSYRKRYDNLIKGITKKGNEPNISKDNKDIGISEDIVNSILDKLLAFEENKGFLVSNITVGKIAEDFNTNSKYVSKIINFNKKKSFVAYINQLRINHAAEELKINPKIRNYTLTALAREFGFNTSESFSKYFYKTYGISPSFYINKLKNEKN